MYEIKYDFLFCLLTYTLSFAALVLFCILTVKCLVDIFKKREIKNKIIKFFLIFVCVAGDDFIASVLVCRDVFFCCKNK